MRIICFHRTWLNVLPRSSLCVGVQSARQQLVLLGVAEGETWCYPSEVAPGLPSHPSRPSHAASPDLGWHQRVCTLFRQRENEDTLCVHLASDYKVVSVGHFLHNSNEYLYLDLSLT